MAECPNPEQRPRQIVLLGSTGSIGTQALRGDRATPRTGSRWPALCAGGGNLELLAEQAVRLAGAARRGRRDRRWPVQLRDLLAAGWPADAPPPVVHAGPEATAELAGLDCDVVLNGVAGAQGLRATLAALDAGRTVALANKESLIAGGPLVTGRGRPGPARAGRLRALRAGPVPARRARAAEVRRLVLTASGGPFRGRRRAELADVTPDAGAGPPDLGHGPADHHQLGDPGQQGPGADRGAPAVRRPVRPDRRRRAPAVDRPLDGGVHRRRRRSPRPSPPDMRLPIALALGWPDRVPGAAAAVDWTQAHRLDVRAAGRRRRSRPSRWPGGPARPAAARPRSSTRPTRSWSAAFHDGAIGFLADRRHGRRGARRVAERARTPTVAGTRVPSRTSKQADALGAASVAARRIGR